MRGNKRSDQRKCLQQEDLLDLCGGHCYLHIYCHLPWPLAGTAGNTILFILILAGCSLLLLICYALIGKKTSGQTGLSPLLGGVKVKGVLKCLLMAAITLAVGYASLMLISYLLNQDYRFWMTTFGEMRVELWFIAARYALWACGSVALLIFFSANLVTTQGLTLLLSLALTLCCSMFPSL